METRPVESAPDIRELGREEVEAILRRNHVGRIAFGYGNRIGLVPVHYVYADGWIHGRTSPGEKLELIRHNRWIAFEVDEIDGLFDWRSVIVHGGFYLLDPDGAPAERASWQHALELLRELIPETFREGDPAPYRTVLFRIAAQEATGRAATTDASTVT